MRWKAVFDEHDFPAPSHVAVGQSGLLAHVADMETAPRPVAIEA
jgi:hypothetical protein